MRSRPISKLFLRISSDLNTIHYLLLLLDSSYIPLLMSPSSKSCSILIPTLFTPKGIQCINLVSFPQSLPAAVQMVQPDLI